LACEKGLPWTQTVMETRPLPVMAPANAAVDKLVEPYVPLAAVLPDTLRDYEKRGSAISIIEEPNAVACNDAINTNFTPLSAVTPGALKGLAKRKSYSKKKRSPSMHFKPLESAESDAMKIGNGEAATPPTSAADVHKLEEPAPPAAALAGMMQAAMPPLPLPLPGLLQDPSRPSIPSGAAPQVPPRPPSPTDSSALLPVWARGRQPDDLKGDSRFNRSPASVIDDKAASLWVGTVAEGIPERSRLPASSESPLRSKTSSREAPEKSKEESRFHPYGGGSEGMKHGTSACSSPRNASTRHEKSEEMQGYGDGAAATDREAHSPNNLRPAWSFLLTRKLTRKLTSVFHPAESADDKYRTPTALSLTNPHRFSLVTIDKNQAGTQFWLEFVTVRQKDQMPVGKPIRGRPSTRWADWKLQLLRQEIYDGELHLQLWHLKHTVYKSVTPQALTRLLYECEDRYKQLALHSQLHVVAGNLPQKPLDHRTAVQLAKRHTDALNSGARPFYHVSQLSEMAVDFQILDESRAFEALQRATDTYQGRPVATLAQKVLDMWQQHLPEDDTLPMKRKTAFESSNASYKMDPVSQLVRFGFEHKISRKLTVKDLKALQQIRDKKSGKSRLFK